MEGTTTSNWTFQTCFISAPVGVDIQPLREALSERKILSTVASDVVIGSNVAHSVREMIGGADFVCAVIPTGPVASTVYFELGLAAGLNKPRLALIEPKADLPLALREQPYARIALSNGEALRFHLDAFLKNAGKSSTESQRGDTGPEPRGDGAYIVAALDRLTAWEAQNFAPSENELVRLIAEVFEASGYVTSTGSEQVEQSVRIDLAVWIDELQSSIENPLPIEVVARKGPVAAEVQQFQHALRTLQGRLGLMVFWKLERPLLPQSWQDPMIVTMNVRELVESVARGDFSRTLLKRRDAIVHSAA